MREWAQKNLRGNTLGATLIRSAFGSAGLKVTNTLVTLAAAVLLARFLGAAGYGLYAFAFSLASLLAVPGQVGLPALLVREVAKYRYQEEWGLIRGLLRRANQIVLGLSLALAAAAAGVAWLLSARTDPHQVEVFLWALPLIPLIALGNIRGAALRGLRLVMQGQLPEMVLRPGLLLLMAGMAVLFGGLTPTDAMALHAIAAALAFGVGASLLRRAIPAEGRAAQPVYETRAWLRSMLPLSLLSGMMIINNQADIVMLGLFTTNADVGVYRAATQGAMLVVFVLSAVNMVIAPYVSQLYTAGETERLQRLATSSARVILLTAVPVAGTFIVFGEEILVVAFGDEYAPGHRALAILCVGQLVNAGAGSVGLLLNMGGFERDTARGVAVATGSNLMLNLLLIPTMGMIGAAIATAVTLVIWNALLCRQVWVRMGIQSTAIRFRFAK
jgi:O-antigen/teichoic acid export membrane protein